MKTKILTAIVFLVLIILLVKVFMLSPQPTSVLSAQEAIDAVLVLYPELAVYQTTDLPPSSIESKQGSGGWYLGFVRRGSGVPGILDAKCYYLDNNKTIISIGEYQQGNSGAVEVINLETCESAVELPQVPPELPDSATKQDEPIVTAPAGTCYTGGCSAQLCSDQPDMVSTCEFKEEYACYQSAVCERQESGQCGWTETSELRACLESR